MQKLKARLNPGTIIAAVLLLALAALVQAFVFSPRLAGDEYHETISASDRAATRANVAAQVRAEREREREARREWKALSPEEREASPWTTWYRKSMPAALAELAQTRRALFAENIFDPYIERPTTSYTCTEHDLNNRRIDGKCNDLEDVMMGAVNTRLGRNINPHASLAERETLMHPDPA